MTVRTALDLTRRGVACAGKLRDPYRTIVLFDLLNVCLRTTRTVISIYMMTRLLYVGMFACMQKRTFTLAIVQASAQHSMILA